MCNVWQNSGSTKEIELEKIEEIFSNRLFRKVEEIVLHGGEPTLRKDIKDIYRILLRFCPKVKRITLSTNGLNPEMARKRIGEVLREVNTKKTILSFTVSVDGLAGANDEIRGVTGSFDSAIRTIKFLKDYQKDFPIELGIITVIQPQNISDLDKVKNLASEYDVDIIFQPLMFDTFYDNSISDPRLQFSEDQLQEYREFLIKTFGRDRTPKGLYWKNHLEMLEGGKRTIPCSYDRYVLSLYPTGEILPCAKEEWILFGNVYEKSVDEIWFSDHSKRIRKRMRKRICPSCTFYCGAEYSLRKEFITYLNYAVKTFLPSKFKRDSQQTL
jgi:MoaA/NifB/PqqE/SkfB family radical SAM enzyme